MDAGRAELPGRLARCSGRRSRGGFLIAGYVALCRWASSTASSSPTSGRGQLVENVVVGPIVAALAFVCSVGNIPLAAVLWAGGISFSGVIAFVFADLIVIPIVLIYRKYYGGRVAALPRAIMFWAMIVAALAVDGIFSALGLVPTHRPSIESIAEREIGWNYTTFLNIVFMRSRRCSSRLTLRRSAKDPVCGMTVDRETTPHRSDRHGETVYFCSAHCKKQFDADPERYLGRDRPLRPAHAGHEGHH